MDYDTYRKQFFTDPAPEQRFGFTGLHGLTLFFSDYAAAVDFYQQVLGPPSYFEGEFTRGWRIGATWLNLVKGKEGSPQNVEVMLVMDSPAGVDSLREAILKAGGDAGQTADQLMYEPVYSCSARDPFGTEIMIYCLR
ncbi:VOC family protein [Chloroflexota bacterium]